MRGTLNLFGYKDKLYMRTIPVKKLFNSSMIHEVVNRGDVFAVDILTGDLTIIPCDAQITPVEAKILIKDVELVPAENRQKELPNVI